MKYMKRRKMRPETKRRIAGMIALLLIAALVLGSVSVFFIQ